MKETQPYKSNLEYLAAGLDSLRALAIAGMAEEHRARGGNPDTPGPALPGNRPGNANLACFQPPDLLLRKARRLAGQHAARTAATMARKTVELPLESLAREYQLDEFEKRLLLAVLGPDLDGSFETALERLAGHRCRSREIRILLALLCKDLEDRIRCRRYFVHDARLIKHGLISLAYSPDINSETDFMCMEISLPRRVASMLLGEYDVDDQVSSFSTVVEPQVRLDQVVLPPQKIAEVLELVRNRDEYVRRRRDWGFDAILQYGKGTIILFSGPPGTGKTMLAHAVAHAAACRLLLVDVRRIVEHSRHGFDENLRRIFHEAALQQAILFFDEADEMFTDRSMNGIMPTLLRELERLDGVCILATNRRQVLDEALDRRILYKLDFEIPTADQREEIWRRHLPEKAPVSADLDLRVLAEEFEFSGGYIKNAVVTAAARAIRRSGDLQKITGDDLRQAALLQRRNRMSAHTDKVIPAITLTDVILDAATRGQVDAFLAASRQVSTVMSAWGFGRKLSRGKGLVALFSGPSGVGKTMTAEAIAGELGKPLQPVRLDTVVSKYVGETGQHLAALFRSAREADAVLFIDEADALFGARLESADHHARYINQEVNVLLTEIERFDGLLILATNRPAGLDSAFERRIPYHVQFHPPDAAARAAIWKKLLPPEAPVDGSLDFNDLARRYPVTGGEIKNIVLRAAYAAATNGGLITQDLMCAAADGRLPLKEKKEIGFAA